MYYHAILQCTQALRNLEAWLDRAERLSERFEVSSPILRCTSASTVRGR
jgi:hypothetical protein